MSDEQYDRLMREAAADYRPPPEPRLDIMWGRIEARVFDAPVIGLRSRPRWMLPLAFAATLLLGVAIGLAGARFGAPGTAVQAEANDVPMTLAASPSPFVGVAGDYLHQTTAFLITVAREIQDGRVPTSTIHEARHLLSTTRLLLDASATDPALLDLLEDLELVLAQVVQLPGNRQAADAALITEALDQRDVLPRLTLLLADAGVAP